MRDDGFDTEFDSGIRASDLGSSFPEGTYRPVPIVWFAAAYILQSLALLFVFAILIDQPSIFLISASALLTFAIGRMTFRRGMEHAGQGWRIATVVMLLANLGIVTLGAIARFA